MYTFLYTVTMIIDILHGHLINSRCRKLQALVTARIVCESYVFTGVCLSTEGVCLSPCWDTTTPRGRPPQEADPPRSRPPQKETPHSKKKFPPPGPHERGKFRGIRSSPPPPQRACWEIRSTRGRYASYWNAILLQFTCTLNNLPVVGTYNDYRHFTCTVKRIPVVGSHNHYSHFTFTLNNLLGVGS